MEKSCQSSVESTITNTSSSSSSSNQQLKQLNKLSHKISKPTPIITVPKKPTSLDPQQPQLGPIEAQSQSSSHPQQQQQQQQQHQPPVYNINKNDFRDVVQRLTGSPAHSSPTPVPTVTTNTPHNNPHPPLILHPSRPQSSRLHRIRPPPLAHLSNRPPDLLSCAPFNNPPLFNPLVNPSPLPASSGFIHRLPPPPPPPGPPVSPLPPLPAVLAAAESPVSAYMRYLHNSISSNPSGFSPLVSPRWNNLPPPPLQPSLPPLPPTDYLQQQQHQAIAPPPQLPSSPVPFGCMNSPRSAAAAAAAASFPMLSPGLLLSPSSFPLSPTVPLTSPKWKGL